MIDGMVLLSAAQPILQADALVIAARAATGTNPHAYLNDVLERLPTHPANRISELLPHLWP